MWKTLKNCSVSLFLFDSANINSSKGSDCYFKYLIVCSSLQKEVLGPGSFALGNTGSAVRCNPGFSPTIASKTGVRTAGSCSVLLPSSCQALSCGQSCQCSFQGAVPTLELMGATVTPPTELPPAPLGFGSSPRVPAPWNRESFTSRTSLGAQLGRILLHHGCFFGFGLVLK